MKTTTVTVRYNNPATGAGPANIKDTTNEIYKYWTASKFGKSIPFETFREGGTYTIGYKTEHRKEYTVKARDGRVLRIYDRRKDVP